MPEQKTAASTITPREQPQLLSDEPADIDALGSHQRVADGIAKLVLSNDGGKAITLEGTWGSGKSTVIKLLKKSLTNNLTKNPHEVQVFTFDAWNHTGDPLRKAFLRELMDFLGGVTSGSAKWIESTEWQEKLRRITIPRDSAIKFSLPIIGNWIRALLVLAGAFIVINTQRSNDVFDWLKNHLSSPFLSVAASWLKTNKGINPSASEWKPIMVLFLFIILYLLIEGLWLAIPKIVACLKKEKTREKTVFQSKFIHPVALLLGRLPQQEISETTKQGDATSVEFRIFFSEMMMTCLNSARKLVIVLDNMDRVRPEEALAIWSTMRLFFDPYEMGRAGWQKQLWLIVPFDPSAVDRLWEAGLLERDVCEVPQTLATESSQNTEDDGPIIGTSVIAEYPYANAQSINPLCQIFRDKSFQTTFHVSQPLPTALEEFFQEQAAKAFGDCSWIPSKDRHHLWVVYSYYIWNLKKLAIPRDLKIFMNEVAALAAVWQGSIPLPLLGVHVLLKKCVTLPAGTAEGAFKIRDSFLYMLEAWEDSTRPSQNSVPSLDEVIRAVELNVDPESVREFTLLKELADWLRSGDTDHILSRFCNRPNFSKLMETILINYSEAWVTASPATLGYAALVLNEICQEQPETLPGNSCWELLSHNVMGVKDWRGVDGKSGEGVATLIRKRQEAIAPETRPELVRVLVASQPHRNRFGFAVDSVPKIGRAGYELPSDKMILSIVNWAEFSNKVLWAVADSWGASLLEQGFSVEGDVVQYGDVILALSRCALPDDTLRYFVTKGGADEFREGLVDCLVPPYLSGWLLESLTDPMVMIDVIGGKWDLERIAKKLLDGFQSSNEPQILGCFEGLLGLAILSRFQPPTNFLERYGANVEEFVGFRNLRNQGYPDAVAYDIMTLLLLIPTQTPPLDDRWFQERIQRHKACLEEPAKLNQVAKKLASLIMKFRILPRIWLKMELLPLDLASGITRELVQSVPKYEDVLAKTIWDHYGVQKQTTKTNLTLLGPISRALAKTSAFLRILAESPLAKDRAELYLVAVDRLNDPEVRGEQRLLINKIKQKNRES